MQNQNKNDLLEKIDICLNLFKNLKKEINKINYENKRIKIENEILYKHLNELNKLILNNNISNKYLKNKENKLISISKINLNKIYFEGFHICHVFYKIRRKINEECIFCLNILNNKNL